ncbi:MAG TPA: ABC transporter permease subunit [Opitutaceae bacterium]|nr:ABC transporter permease subunit [Opitutaceae bacterium]
MSWGAIGTIYAKELRDQLRDRRTLLSTIVIPTFIMPAIVLGVGKMASAIIVKARQEIPRIMVIGGADSPGVRADLERSGKFRVETATPDWRSLISEKRVRAAAEIPAGFERALGSGSAPAVNLYDYEGELKSGLAVEELRNFFLGLRDRTTARLLKERGIPATVARPFEVRQANVAPPEKVGGNLLGGIVPYIIVLICFMGAMSPAMDITAGEKERGTMETLLCSPVARTDIVLGKFLVVLTGSLAAVVCSLVSMGATLVAVGASIGGMAAGPGGPGGAAPTIDPAGVLGVLAMVIPVSVLFSAVLFAVSLFAKSMKEAQSYAGPLVFVVILPAIAGLLPGIDLNLRLAFVPILNLSLVCKEMLSGVWHWGYIGVIFGSTALYAAAALALAVWMFRREGVIFRT